MFDLVNIFEVFLPQLLRYPNPSDPLNGEAAALIMRDPKAYEVKVKEYVKKYAINTANIDLNANGKASKLKQFPNNVATGQDESDLSEIIVSSAEEPEEDEESGMMF